MSSPVAGMSQSDSDQALDRLPVVPFASGAEHLLAEADWLRLVLYREVLRLRAARRLVESDFRGLFVSDEQVDAVLRDAESARPTAARLESQIRQERDRISARVEASLTAGIPLPLPRLIEIFALTPLEGQMLAACAAPELDLRFETLYSYLQNDVNRKRPTADLILRVFSDSPVERFGLRAAFSSRGPLIHHRLICFAKNPQHPDQSSLARPMRVDDRIVEYLLGQDNIDDRLRDVAFVVEPRYHLPDLQLPPVFAKSLASAARAFADQGAVLFFCGPHGVGKRTAAEALSAETHRRLLVADLSQAVVSPVPLPEILALLRREMTLHDANLFLARGEALSPEPGDPVQHRRDLERHLCPGGRLVFVGSASPWVDLRIGSQWPALSFEFPVPSFEQRTRFWDAAIRRTLRGGAPSVDVAMLANKYILTGGEIRAAANNAAHRALVRGGALAESGSELAMEELEAAARSQSNQGIRRMAQKVDTTQGWGDLILPPRPLQQLREVCASERYRQVVYSEWGFHRRLALGKGLNVLFYGPSGTGKTMAAGVLAHELGLDLYKIDLSTVVSKYIGETEKQLNRIFRQAQSSNAVLFFDEADALFGKRTEVKDAHDRYANVEVAYLLQKMEEYEGIVILATNYRKNIDDAFVRRMHHIVEFPLPDAEYRERIWTGLMPSGAPLDKDVDFRFLARQFELAGGNIRNIILAAAFLAAEEGRAIRMEHFILGTSRELQKLGKLPARADFREYFELIRTRS